MKPERNRKWGIFGSLMLTANVLVLLALILSYLAGIISPARFWPLAFAGMAYPILLAFTAFFTFYWLLKRKWFLFLNVALILVKWDYVQETVQFHKRPNEEAPAGTKVMSFNVRLFDQFNWIEGNNTEQAIFQFIGDQEPDILCIQEYHGTNKKGADPLIELLKVGSLQYHHLEMNPKKTKWKSINGIATFSRFPTISKGIVFYTPEHNNMGIFTDVIMDGDTVRIYNLHLQSIGLQNKDYAVIDELMENQEMNDSRDGKNLLKYMRDGFVKRAEQAELVAEHVRTCRYPVILCGDFNDIPTSYAYQTIQKGLKDSFSESGFGIGATYVRVPFFRIDNVLHSPHFKASNHQVHKEILSDHLAISCRLSRK
jgi:endonuclease/exonuclease/phosphatase family metal-dependent hydrolase